LREPAKDRFRLFRRITEAQALAFLALIGLKSAANGYLRHDDRH
jgi:hypothetical protein